MPNNLFTGNAPAKAQVWDFTFSGTWEATDLVTATINGKTLSVVAGSTTIADVIDAVITAWNALDTALWPEHREITPTRSGTTILRLTAGTPGKPFEVTLASTENDGSSADAQTISARTVTQRSVGPAHFDDPLNWSLGRVPDSGDTLVFDQTDRGPKYGLTQRATFTTDHTTEELTTFGDFRVGQVVRVFSSDTLPAGLTAATDYTIDAYDPVTGVMTLDGVTLTDNGTGTHTIEVQAAAIVQMAGHSGPIGLPRYDADGLYRQYRPTFLAIGLLPDAGPCFCGEGNIRVGQGPGSGSGLIRIDVGASVVRAVIITTGGGTEENVPACLLVSSATTNEVDLYEGEAGVAFFPDQTSELKKLRQRGGLFIGGEGLTISASAVLDKTGGELQLLDCPTTTSTLRLRG